MKRLLATLSIIGSFVCLSFLLQSCTSPRQAIAKAEAQQRQAQEELRRRYSGHLQTASAQMVEYLKGQISPQSGRNTRYKLDYSYISYNQKENAVSADVLLTWEARDFWSGVSYGECQVAGLITVYMPVRQTDNTQAILSRVKYNDHLVRVAKEQKVKDLNRNVRITIR